MATTVGSDRVRLFALFHFGIWKGVTWGYIKSLAIRTLPIRSYVFKRETGVLVLAETKESLPNYLYSLLRIKKKELLMSLFLFSSCCYILVKPVYCKYFLLFGFFQIDFILFYFSLLIASFCGFSSFFGVVYLFNDFRPCVSSWCLKQFGLFWSFVTPLFANEGCRWMEKMMMWPMLRLDFVNVFSRAAIMIVHCRSPNLTSMGESYHDVIMSIFGIVKSYIWGSWDISFA